MQIAPPVHLTTATQPETSPWELWLRYAAATAATLVAIAAAQLVLPNHFVLLLACITLAGVPVSLFLRRSDMRFGGLRVPRALWNSLTVLSAFLMASYYVFWTLRDFLVPMFNGYPAQSFLVRFGPSEWVQLLMQVFLLFAAFRSFSLISDKDATLATVPSFSVLLLLIPLHKSIEVVVYFLVWSMVASLLFALDHRADVRTGVTAFVPPLSPGQDARLAARSLAAILGISLAASTGFSYFLTSRQASERSTAEDAINALVSRLTSAALSVPEASVNGGPERQIDFGAGPIVPSNTLLWEGRAWTSQRRPVHPAYWRLFSFNTYNGVIWSQGVEAVTRVELAPLTPERWPLRRPFPSSSTPAARPASGLTFNIDPRLLRGGAGRYDPRFGDPRFGDSRFLNSRFRAGYDIQRAAPRVTRQFGPRAETVVQEMTAKAVQVGFVPLLPAPRIARLRESDQKEIRFRADGGVDVGVIQAGQTVRFLSDVPALPEYGIGRGGAPSVALSAAQITASGAELAPEARRAALQLPPRLPQRVSEMARSTLRAAPAKESNYRLAQRLALAIQGNAVYTLRPRAVPRGRDATDFFLFEGARRGYCTYFAGALAVLCRTQNIPARVVSGFYNTKWSDDGIEGNVELRDGNAHAWTEVWVEGWGWALVDATPTDDRGENAPTWLENWRDWGSSTYENVRLVTREHLMAVCVVGVALAFALLLRWAGALRGVWLRRRAATDTEAERRLIFEIYRATARRVARKFRPRAPWETPDEWLGPFASTLSRSDAEALRRLTSLYLAARYTDSPLPRGSAHLARETAAQIAWKPVKPSDASRMK